MSLRKFPVLVFIALIALRSVGAAAVPMLAGTAHIDNAGVVCFAGLAVPVDHALGRHSCCDEAPPADGTPSSQHHVASSCSGLCAMIAALPTLAGLPPMEPGIAPAVVAHALSSLLAPPPLEPPRV